MKLTTSIKYDHCDNEVLIDGVAQNPISSNSTCDLDSYKTGDGALRIDACKNKKITLLFVGYSNGVGGFGGPGREHWTSCSGEYPGGKCSSTRLSDQRNGEITMMGQRTEMILDEIGIRPPPSTCLNLVGTMINLLCRFKITVL